MVVTAKQKVDIKVSFSIVQNNKNKCHVYSGFFYTIVYVGFKL